MTILLLIVGLILFVALVVVHEFGHFVTARRGGVEVEEFGIGFPPRAWKKRVKSKKGDYDFTLNWLPLGGFVKLKGEHDADTEPGSFGAAKLGTKVKIMLAGVGMNLATAFVLLTLVALAGMPKLIDNQFTVVSDTKVLSQKLLIGFVEPDSPASKIGLQTQDELTHVNNVQVNNAQTFPEVTKKYAGQTVQLQYVHEGQAKSAQVQLRNTKEVEDSKNTNDPKGYLGISPAEYTLQRSTWSAPIVAGGLIKQFTQLTLSGLGNAVANLFRGETAKASEQVSGPLGIFFILKQGSTMGYQFILLIIAIISLTLAIMNVLPIPALDGGRLFVTLVYRGFRIPLKEKTEDMIHGTGFAALMILFVLITVVDVKRFF